MPIKINGNITYQEIAISPVQSSPFLLGTPFLKSTAASLVYNPLAATTLKLFIRGKHIETTIEPVPEDQHKSVARRMNGWDDDEGN